MSVSTYSIPNPKINPATRPAIGLKPDGSPDDPDRVEIGPTDKAFQEWAALGITAPNLTRIREFRLHRVVAELQKRELDAVLLFDPLNIRYATDSMNMQVWVSHNPSRAAMVTADGYLVLWDFHGSDHLSNYLPLINERRHGAGFIYFIAGDKEEEKANEFAAQVDEVVRQQCGKGRRLAIDKIEILGLRALDALGFETFSGQEVMEHAREIKCPDEINAMRCSIATTEIAIAEMRKVLEPGIAEVELWAVMHAENIKRGGEWIETRILSSGPRTNPWMQEAGPRRVQDGDLVGFDTDLIGPYGICTDISRTWYCGDGKPSDEQRRLHDDAYTYFVRNQELLKPGTHFRELIEAGATLPDYLQEQRYAVVMHGVGLCDEFPSIPYPQDSVEGAWDYVLEPGMVICNEVYAGKVGGRDGIKLEDQILITETGYENLTRCPFDAKLMG